MDGARFDKLVTSVTQTGSRRQMVRALAVGVGVSLVARDQALAAAGIRPIRCFKRGEECLVGGATPCCGNLGCALAEDGRNRCQKVGRIKPA